MPGGTREGEAAFVGRDRFHHSMCPTASGSGRSAGSEPPIAIGIGGWDLNLVKHVSAAIEATPDDVIALSDMSSFSSLVIDWTIVWIPPFVTWQQSSTKTRMRCKLWVACHCQIPRDIVGDPPGIKSYSLLHPS